MDVKEKFESAKKWFLGIRTIDEAEEGIHKSQVLQHALKTWQRRSGKVALGLVALGVVSRAFPIILAAGAVGAVYGGIRLASYLLDKNIELKREAEIEMHAAEDKNKPAPGMKPTVTPKLNAKVTGSFNAATIPANDAGAAEAPKKSLLSRFGINI